MQGGESADSLFGLSSLLIVMGVKEAAQLAMVKTAPCHPPSHVDYMWFDRAKNGVPADRFWVKQIVMAILMAIPGPAFGLLTSVSIHDIVIWLCVKTR